jgi:hypothetical protein
VERNQFHLTERFWHFPTMVVLVLENVHNVVRRVLIPSEHLATGTPYSRSSARVGLCF